MNRRRKCKGRLRPSAIARSHSDSREGEFSGVPSQVDWLFPKQVFEKLHTPPSRQTEVGGACLPGAVACLPAPSGKLSSGCKTQHTLPLPLPGSLSGVLRITRCSQDVQWKTPIRRGGASVLATLLHPSLCPRAKTSGSALLDVHATSSVINTLSFLRPRNVTHMMLINLTGLGSPVSETSGSGNNLVR